MYGERGRDCDKLYKVTARLQPWLLKYWKRTIESEQESSELFTHYKNMSVTAKIHSTSQGRSHGFMEAICISEGRAFGLMSHGCTLTAQCPWPNPNNLSFLRKRVTQTIMNIWVNKCRQRCRQQVDTKHTPVVPKLN